MDICVDVGFILHLMKKLFFEKHLDPKRGDEIADYMTKCQIDGIFEGAEDVYFTSKSFKI